MNCLGCVHLRPFELVEDVLTCVVVNIRIHRVTAADFWCRYHEASEEVGDTVQADMIATAETIGTIKHTLMVNMFMPEVAREKLSRVKYRLEEELAKYLNEDPDKAK